MTATLKDLAGARWYVPAGAAGEGVLRLGFRSSSSTPLTGVRRARKEPYPRGPAHPLPVVLGEGIGAPRIRLEGCVDALFPAFTTAEGCKKAIERWWPGHVVLEITNPTRFNAGARKKGITVAVDLRRDDEDWIFHSFPPAVLSPGGEA